MTPDAAPTPADANTPPRWSDFIDPADLAALIDRAFDEDLGEQRIDLTSACFIPADAAGSAAMRARCGGVLAGAALLTTIADRLDVGLRVELERNDGDRLSAGAAVAAITGPMRSLLSFERTALNFVTHLSGIATLTDRFVAAAAGTHARIFDTRKTLPGWRRLQKYAVVCGGGHSHRMGLYDAVLIKDNHLACHSAGDDRSLTDRVRDAIAKARGHEPAPTFVEVEVDTLEQLAAVLPTGVDIVLLDNMTPDALTSAAAMRDRTAPGVQLEASGGVTLDNVAAVAAAGVDRIAIGALTHSAPALDIGLDMP